MSAAIDWQRHTWKKIKIDKHWQRSKKKPIYHLPVMNEALSDARNAMASATSWAKPGRPSGCVSWLRRKNCLGGIFENKNFILK